MILKLDEQGVAAIREFAAVMPKVMEEAKQEIQNLKQVLQKNEDELGIHYEFFQDLIAHLDASNQFAMQDMEELVYALKETADRMEDYIKRTNGAATRVIRNNLDYVARFQSCAEERLAKTPDSSLAKRLYQNCKSLIHVSNYDYRGTAHYHPGTRSINLCAMADMHNPTGAMSTYFHETGHLLDHNAGNGHAWISSDPEYRACLERDFKAYCQKTLLDEHCAPDDVYDIISEEISGNDMAGVSDIFGSLSNCVCQGDWGHSRDYWAGDPTRVEKEAFANMFEASIGDEQKRENMKRYFPTAYAKFENLLEEFA